ncbi:MAG: TlpA family protein disulfide reductase [Aquificaceae bacterium]
MYKYLSSLLLSLFFFSCSGDTLPKIEVKTLEGKRVYLSQYKGKKVLLYVWSKTCAGHSKDLGLLSEIANKRKDYLVISYAVAMEIEDVRESYRQLGIRDNFLTLVDTEVKFNDYFPITFLPSTYIFDEKGKFVKAYQGLYVP